MPDSLALPQEVPGKFRLAENIPPTEGNAPAGVEKEHFVPLYLPHHVLNRHLFSIDVLGTGKTYIYTGKTLLAPPDVSDNRPRRPVQGRAPVGQALTQRPHCTHFCR